MRKLQKLLGNPNDLISINLDIDVNEDTAALKEYAYGYGFDWFFAVAPIEIARALWELVHRSVFEPATCPDADH